jgi:glycosyltransferase involved in cell wall biosynthesis
VTSERHPDLDTSAATVKQDHQPAVQSVVLLTPSWGRDGGVATHVKASAVALAQRGVHVRVLAAHVESKEPVPGVTVLHQPELLERGAPLDRRLGDCLASPPQVFHIHQVDDLKLMTHLQVNAAVVISAHGYPGCTSGVHYFDPGQECERAHGPGCIPNLIARGCAHTRHPRTLPLKYLNVTRGLAALRRADLAVSYSSTIDRHLATNAIARRAVVPLFPTLAAPESPDVPAAGRGVPAAGRVVFAGRVEPTKGVAILIQAMRELEAELVICGEGRQLQGLRQLARRLGLERRVRFAGWLEPELLAQELAAASVVAVPSLWPEPFGLVGIEALALGCPVVASATGGVHDWLAPGVGVGVTPGDPRALARALAELLADPERRRAMGAAGRRLVAERFSAERHVQELLAAYAKACSARRSRQPGPPPSSRALGERALQ